MREISPAENASAEELFNLAPPEVKEIIHRIRKEKKEGTRPLPSAQLDDRSEILTSELRRKLLDDIARLVDENLCGRSEMCLQFAQLLQMALSELGYYARVRAGVSVYYQERREIFRWPHAWVRIGNEVVDGNVDILSENPMVPAAVSVQPYWGPIRETPNNRRLREQTGGRLPYDKDVMEIWWPELRAALNDFLPK